MKINISRNTKNIIKFMTCAIAGVVTLWLTTVYTWNMWHIILLVLCVSVFIGFAYHVFTDDPDQSDNKSE